MVYSKRKGYRKKYYPKRKYGLTKAVKPIIKSVLKRNIEVKNFKTVINNADIIRDPTAVGAVFQLNSLSLGVLPNEMLGREITNKGVMLAGVIKANNNVTRCATARVMLVWHKSPDRYSATLPVPANFLEQNAGTPPIVLYSGIERSEAKNYKILYDKRVTLSPSTGDKGQVQIKKYVSLKDRKSVYYYNSGNFSQTGALYLVLLSDAITDFPLFYGQSQLYFTDA